MARWFRSRFVFPVARPFVCGCSHISTMLRFHTPLIKPDVRISRIRLSDKATHAFAHGTVAATFVEAGTVPSSRYRYSSG